MKFFSWEKVVDLTKYASMSAADLEKDVAAQKASILTKWVD